VAIGGSFTSAGGATVANAAAVDAATGDVVPWAVDATTGRPLPFAPPVLGDVRAMLAHDGKLYLAGTFTRVDGKARRFLAAVAARDGHLMPWAPRFDGPVVALAAHERAIYAAGTFDKVNGKRRRALRRRRADPTPGRRSGEPTTLLPAGARLYVAGTLLRVAGQGRRGVAAVNARSGSLLAWNARADGDVESLLLRGRTLYFGGSSSTSAAARGTRSRGSTPPAEPPRPSRR